MPHLLHRIFWLEIDSAGLFLRQRAAAKQGASKLAQSKGAFGAILRPRDV
jgi:hypothetical protein